MKSLYRTVVIVILLLSIIEIGSANFWVSNSNLVSGLGDVGERSSPTVFQINSTWYLISGEKQYHGVGTFGYRWSGSTWISNSSIISGLGAMWYDNPVVFSNFYNDSTVCLIRGNSGGTFQGYNWTGSTWSSNSNLVSGLVTVPSGYSSPTSFQINSTWHLISGSYGGTFYGYHWGGSSWTSNSTIISGLSSVSYSCPTTISTNSSSYLVTGKGNGEFSGYHWNGSGWISNSTIISGLGDVGDYSTPSAFYDFYGDSTWSLIIGEYDGYFNGYDENKIPNLYTPTNESSHNFNYPPSFHEITFTWRNTGSQSYYLEISKDSGFVMDVVNAYPIENYSTQMLEIDDYWWRVSSYDYSTSTYGYTSSEWIFNITENSPAVGTAVQGIVYDNNGDTLKDVLVTLWNNTFSDTYITGTNGYYLFDELSNETYSIQATKYKYDDSIIYYVTLTTNETYVRNILMQEILGEYEWEHYVKFQVMSETGTLHVGVGVIVYYPSTEVIGDDSGVTGSDGGVTFVLDEKKYYKITFTHTDPVFDKTIYLYPKEDFYIIVPIITTDVMLNGLEYSLYFDENDNIIFKQTDPNNEAIWTNMTITNSTGYVTSYYSTNDTISWSYLMANGSDTYCANVTFNTVTNGLMYIQKCTTPAGYPVPLKDLSDNTKNILSIFILIIFALLFGHAYVKSGAVIVSLMACLLWYMDWLQVSGAILTIILLIAVGSKLGELRR